MDPKVVERHIFLLSHILMVDIAHHHSSFSRGISCQEQFHTDTELPQLVLFGLYEEEIIDSRRALNYQNGKNI